MNNDDDATRRNNCLMSISKKSVTLKIKIRIKQSYQLQNQTVWINIRKKFICQIRHVAIAHLRILALIP